MIPCTYDDSDSFSDGLAGVKLNDKWGFIDKSNTLVIPCKYDVVRSFSDGRAQVKFYGEWGTVDKSGVETWY